jgi:hypothetical protein
MHQKKFFLKIFKIVCHVIFSHKMNFGGHAYNHVLDSHVISRYIHEPASYFSVSSNGCRDVIFVKNAIKRPTSARLLQLRKKTRELYNLHLSVPATVYFFEFFMSKNVFFLMKLSPFFTYFFRTRKYTVAGSGNCIFLPCPAHTIIYMFSKVLFEGENSVGN